MGQDTQRTRPIPSTAQGKATQAHIVRTAAQLMFEQGVERTSIPEVQKIAGVSASQVYHYFGDKKGLVRAVIAHQIETSLEHQRPVLDHLDSIEALEAWRDGAAASLARRNCRGGCEVGSLASELVETAPEFQDDLVAAFAAWEKPIRAGLHAMQDRGDLRAEADCDELALALLAALQGGILLSQVRRDITPFEAAMNTVIDHIRELTVSAGGDR